jgi:hypothetical protein
MNPFNGMELHVNKLMTGSKVAVKCGNVLAVSPAMASLMRGASPKELEALCRSIKIMELESPCKWSENLIGRTLFPPS